ncbi:MAG: glycosyltransferase [Microbacterium sp.]
MPEAAGEFTVVHVAHTTEPGGAELALNRMLVSPCRSWHAVLALPEGLEPGVFADAAAHGVAVVEAGPAQTSGAARASLLAAPRFVRQLLAQAGALRRSGAFEGADVVHANSTRSAVAAALALRGDRIPLVVHLRDRIEVGSLGRIGYLAFRLLAVPRAAGFIANSGSTAQTVRPLLRHGQFVEVLPSAIGTSRVRHVPSGAPGAVVRIGMVARLDPWKGHEELIRAFALAGVDDRASLTLIGGPARARDDYADRLVELAASLGLDNVTLTGHRDDVPDQIDALDVCVQFSAKPEPMGQNVLQYLARGRAVIAADDGGPAEWITDGRNGLLVPPRDVPALAAALRRAVDDPSLRASLAAGAAATEGLPDDCGVTRRHAEAFVRAVSG